MDFEIGDGSKLTLDEGALAHHVKEGNIPAEIAALWLKPGCLKEAIRKEQESIGKLLEAPFFEP